MKTLNISSLKKKIIIILKLVSKIDALWRGSLGREEEEWGWREGVAGAGPWEHLSGNHPGRNAGSGEGTSGTRVSQPSLPCWCTCGCPALPQARLEVFQSIPSSGGI